MIKCRACLWRCIQAVDASHHKSLRNLGRDATPSLLFGRQRHFSRTSSKAVRKIDTEATDLTEIEKLDILKDTPWHNSTQAAGLKKSERKGLTRPPTVPTLKRSEGGLSEKRYELQETGLRIPKADYIRRKRELQHLTDPLELAQFVKQQLGKDKSTEMLQLIQMASHSMQCIVSWNHIIDYFLAKGRVSHAIRIYNDMKKRAQFPDSYTYTILLRGLSINAHESGALMKALSIYHSMSAPNSRVQPSIIHTNAMLKVCARAADMDALWGVVAKIPQNGPAQANAITYVTILNAVRQSLLVKPPDGETAQELAVRRERGIMEGRRIWEEIIHKWRAADLVIEEELVCAMGRLLLVGMRPRDWDDVLSLVEQTMDIPRLVPQLGTPARQEAGYQRVRAPNVPEDFRYADEHLTPETGVSVRGEEFIPLIAQGVGTAVANPLTYATPSNNTLSLILEACQKVVAAKAGEEYWDLLTDPTTYNVVPDVNNLNFLLRLLRQNRSSAKMAELFTADFVKDLDLKPGTFRIAMSTCVRDKNNHNSLRHANKVLEVMGKALEDADPKTVAKYAELAITHPLAKGPELMEALARLQPITKNIRIQLGVGAARKNSQGGEVGASYLTGEERKDAIAALRKIFGLHDRLINSDLVSEDEKRPVKASRAKMSSYLHRMTFKDDGHKKRREEFRGEEKGEGEGGTKDDVEAQLRGDRRRSGLSRGSGAWRQRNVIDEEKRKSWFSPTPYNAA